MEDVQLEKQIKAMSGDLNLLAAALVREFHGNDQIRRSAYALQQSSGQLNLLLLHRQLRRQGR